MNIIDVHASNLLHRELYKLKTGKTVNIQHIGKNKKCLAVPIEPSLEELMPHVYFKNESVSFNSENFTNIHDLFWDPKKAKVMPFIHSSNKPFHLYNQVKKDKSTIGAINGSFFFLADIAERVPLDLPYNLCVRNGHVKGLPSHDQPCAIIKNGTLTIETPNATGVIKIGKHKMSWVGSESKLLRKKSNVVLYNSKSTEVIKMREPKTNIQIGILDSKNITTPKHKNVLDIVIRARRNGELYVYKLVQGGGTHFFDGLFILQVKKTEIVIHKNDQVIPISLDGLKLSGILSAITVGRNVFDPYFSKNMRILRHDARSLIAKDKKGMIHLIVFDGSKYIPGFLGVSAKELHHYFKNDFEWAYFLDGGGSSRLIVRKERQLQLSANEFIFKKMENGAFLWDSKKARIIASSIVLRAKS